MAMSRGTRLSRPPGKLSLKLKFFKNKMYQKLKGNPAAYHLQQPIIAARRLREAMI
jgi:hypothetical protein